MSRDTPHMESVLSALQRLPSGGGLSVWTLVVATMLMACWVLVAGLLAAVGRD